MSKKKIIKLKDLLNEQSFFLGIAHPAALNNPFPQRTKKDNFTFKGFPDPNEKLTEGSYSSDAINDFIKKNDVGDEYNIPRIKVFGDKGDTKYLNVTFDALREISKILKKMKT